MPLFCRLHNRKVAALGLSFMLHPRYDTGDTAKGSA